MEQLDWMTQIGRTVAAEVRRLRTERGMSAQQLSDRCAELGMQIPRTVLSNLENGRRENVTVAEVLILGAALGVPPASLIFPVGFVTEVDAIPGASMHPLHAIQWLSGESPGLFGLGGQAEWMRTPIFMVRRVQDGKDQLNDKLRRIMQLKDLERNAPSEELRRLYGRAVAEEEELYEKGRRTVQDWIEFLPHAGEDGPEFPNVPYPDVEPPSGTVRIHMVGERPPVSVDDAGGGDKGVGN